MGVKILCCIFLLITTSDCWEEIQIGMKCYDIMENDDCTWLSSEEICSTLLQAAVCDKVQSCVETTWSTFTYDGHCEDDKYRLELKLMRKSEQYKEAARENRDLKTTLQRLSKKCADKFDDEEMFDKCVTYYEKLFLAYEYLETSFLDMELTCRLHNDPCTSLYDIPYQRDKCDACMLVANHSQLLSSSRKSVEAFCSEVATEDVQKCSSIVNKYAPAVGQLQSFGVDPNNMCALMDICPIETVINGDECFSCNLAMNLLGLLVQRVDSVPDCKEAPFKWHDLCQAFTVNYYVDYLLFMRRVKDWDVFCDNLTSCKSPSVISSMKAEKKATNLVSTSTCEACLTVVQVMKRNQQFAKAILERDCKESSSDQHSLECEHNTRRLSEINLVLTHVPSLAICQYFNLCPVRNN